MVESQSQMCSIFKFLPKYIRSHITQHINIKSYSYFPMKYVKLGVKLDEVGYSLYCLVPPVRLQPGVK